MAKQLVKKVIDRILHFPHKEKGCSYICGPHLEPCVMVRAHDGDCECRNCDSIVALREKIAEIRDKCPQCGEEATYRTPDGVWWDSNAHYWKTDSPNRSDGGGRFVRLEQGMSEPTNDDLNRAAHAYLGRCWHLVTRIDADHHGRVGRCNLCPETGLLDYQHPDYCSDRNAARELVEAVVDKVGCGKFAFELNALLGIQSEDGIYLRMTKCVLAPARTQVLAALKAAGGVE